jgi:hypothetical protein
MYVIHTERKNIEGIIDILVKHVSGFTLNEGTGYWVDPETKRTYHEHSLSITLVDAELATVKAIAVDIKALNEQSKVLYLNYKQVKDHWE